LDKSQLQLLFPDKKSQDVASKGNIYARAHALVCLFASYLSLIMSLAIITGKTASGVWNFVGMEFYGVNCTATVKAACATYAGKLFVSPDNGTAVRMKGMYFSIKPI